MGRWWRLEPEVEDWYQNVVDARDAAREGFARADRLDRDGRPERAAKARADAQDHQQIAEKMDRCRRNPRHGGPGYPR